MRKNLLFACLLIAGVAFAQDIKVKKGDLLIDGSAAAKISDAKNVYSFSSTSGSPLFSVKLMSPSQIGGDAGGVWLEFTSANGVVKEVSDLKTGFSLSSEKIISENVIKHYNLIGKSGPDEAKIASFFASEDRSFSKPILEKIAAIKAENSADDVIAEQNNLKVEANGNITSNGKLIGKVVTTTTGKLPGIVTTKLQIIDLNKIIVATTEYNTTSSSTYNLNTYDKQTIPVMLAKDDALSSRLVKSLYAKGYHLGDMKASIEENLANKNKEEINSARADSKNIYDVSGYVIDGKGNKIEGPVTIEFESIDAKRGVGKGMSDLTNFGGSVSIKANDKTQYFKAKDGVKFCAGERCFLGTSGSEDGGLNSGSGSELSVLGESQFFEIIYENNGQYILSHVKSPKAFYLKLKNQNKAVYLGDKAFMGTKSDEKIKKAFDKYVNCSAIDFSKYDTKTKEGLVQVIEDYSKSCK